MTRITEQAEEVGVRRIRRFLHRFIGHRGKPGENGWENFMTGLFCSCGAMVDQANKEVFIRIGHP